MPTYEVTCTFDGSGYGTPGIAIDRLLNTIGAMRAEGVEIDHRDSTIESDGDNSVTEMNTRFTAPTEGIVGWHIYRARLPASGIRRVK